MYSREIRIRTFIDHILRSVVKLWLWVSAMKFMKGSSIQCPGS